MGRSLYCPAVGVQAKSLTDSQSKTPGLPAVSRKAFQFTTRLAQFTTRLAPIAPAEGCARWNEINIRPMYAVQDSFKHWTAARRRIDYPIRECPVWRKATSGSGSKTDVQCRTGIRTPVTAVKGQLTEYG